MCEVTSQTRPAAHSKPTKFSHDCPAAGMGLHAPDVVEALTAQTSNGRHGVEGSHARPVARVVVQLPVSRPLSLHVVAMHSDDDAYESRHAKPAAQSWSPTHGSPPRASGAQRPWRHRKPSAHSSSPRQEPPDATGAAQ